jgi:hypothetical protein
MKTKDRPCAGCNGAYDCSLCEFNPDLQRPPVSRFISRLGNELGRDVTTGSDPAIIAGRWLFWSIVVLTVSGVALCAFCL